MTDLPEEQTWMILVELLTDLRKRGLEIPSDVTEDVRLARATLNFYKTDPTDPERMKEIGRINTFLNSVQNTLIDMAENVNETYRDEWIEKLKKASRGEKVYELPEEKSKFIVGAPSGFSTVRVTFKEPISEDRLQDVAERYNVIIEFESDEVIAIYGDEDNVKKSLKEIASFFKEYEGSKD